MSSTFAAGMAKYHRSTDQRAAARDLGIDSIRRMLDDCARPIGTTGS